MKKGVLGGCFRARAGVLLLLVCINTGCRENFDLAGPIGAGQPSGRAFQFDGLPTPAVVEQASVSAKELQQHIRKIQQQKDALDQKISVAIPKYEAELRAQARAVQKDMMKYHDLPRPVENLHRELQEICRYLLIMEQHRKDCRGSVAQLESKLRQLERMNSAIHCLGTECEAIWTDLDAILAQARGNIHLNLIQSGDAIPISEQQIKSMALKLMEPIATGSERAVSMPVRAESTSVPEMVIPEQGVPEPINAKAAGPVQEVSAPMRTDVAEPVQDASELIRPEVVLPEQSAYEPIRSEVAVSEQTPKPSVDQATICDNNYSTSAPPILIVDYFQAADNLPARADNGRLKQIRSYQLPKPAPTRNLNIEAWHQQYLASQLCQNQTFSVPGLRWVEEKGTTILVQVKD